jgi:hypothetical protein
VDVPAAPVGVLLGPGCPDAEPRPLAGGEPDPVVLARQDGQPEPAVEALKRAGIARLEDELADAPNIASKFIEVSC